MSTRRRWWAVWLSEYPEEGSIHVRATSQGMALQGSRRPGRPVIAALYVAEGGVYYGLADVDPGPEARDARLYAGPWPVVAHPPCQRWGRYWHGGPSVTVRKVKGDDGGGFPAPARLGPRGGGGRG